MTVTAIIPVYGRQDSCTRAIRSALLQTRPLSEIIVVDDASPEPFVPLPEFENDSRFKLIRLEKNAGAAGARNAGIAQASGEWLAFLDSDDLWLPGKLSSQIAIAEADKNDAETTFYASGFVLHQDAKQQVRTLIPREADKVEQFASGCWFAPGSTLLIKRKLFDRIGGFDARLRRLEDLDFFLRAGLSGARLRVTPTVGAYINVGMRPSPVCLEHTCEQIETKWLREPSTQLNSKAASRLAAYLDIERSSACRYAGAWQNAAYYLARSVWRAPRASVHLESWWTNSR